MRSVWPWTTRTRAVIDAERIGADLRHRGLEALPDRGAAGDQLDRARRIDRRCCALSDGPSPLFSTKMRKAGADQFAARRGGVASSRLQLVPADARQRLVEQARVVAGIVDDLGAERVERRA